MALKELPFVMSAKIIEDICRTYRAKDSKIKIGNETIMVSKELSILYSKAVYRHFSESNKDFVINLSQKGQISQESLIICLKKILSLVEGAEFIKIDKSEVQSFEFLSRALKNASVGLAIDQMMISCDSNQLKWNSLMLPEFDDFPTSKDFCFQVCGDRFECPTVLARLLSSNASRRLTCDSTSDIFIVNPPDGGDNIDFLNAFSMIFSLLYGKPLKIPAEKAKLFEFIALQIGNEELLSALRSFNFEIPPVSISNIYELLRKLPIGVGSSQFSEAVEFAASNFGELNFNGFETVPIHSIERVIDSPKLKLQSEIQLFEFIDGLVGLRRMEAIPLLSRVKFEYLDSETMEKFLRIMNAGLITTDIWNSLSSRIKCEVKVYTPSLPRWDQQKQSSVEREIKSLEMSNSDLKAKLSGSEKENFEIKTAFNIETEMREKFGADNSDLQKKVAELTERLNPNLNAKRTIELIERNANFMNPYNERQTTNNLEQENEIQNAEDEIKNASTLISEQVSASKLCLMENQKLKKRLNAVKMKLTLERMKTKQFPLINESEGVFAFLNRNNSSQSPWLEGIIKVSASSFMSESYRPENALVWGEGSEWQSKGESDEWFQIDFFENTFILKEFSILSNPQNLPQSFSIWASNIICNNTELENFSIPKGESGRVIAIRFQVDSDLPYRRFKIVQNGPCTGKGGHSSHFSMFSIEFFGSLVCPKTSNLI